MTEFKGIAGVETGVDFAAKKFIIMGKSDADGENRKITAPVVSIVQANVAQR